MHTCLDEHHTCLWYRYNSTNWSGAATKLQHHTTNVKKYNKASVDGLIFSCIHYDMIILRAYIFIDKFVPQVGKINHLQQCVSSFTGLLQRKMSNMNVIL